MVESLLCALIEESAELYSVVSDVPLPCDEGMMDLHIYNVSPLLFLSRPDTNYGRRQPLDDTQSKTSSTTARIEPNSSTLYPHSPIELLHPTS